MENNDLQEVLNDGVPKQTQPNNHLLIPTAIIVAGLLIAGAIFYSSKQKAAGLPKNTGTGSITAGGAKTADQTDGTENLKPITGKDHILGKPDAPVKIVEFSDTECPFCKRFHFTMKEIMNEYGKKGQVAWVYRHFPLDSLHSKARKEAQATECANEFGGNGKFWEYLDRLFETTPSNDQLDLALLPKIAGEVGLDKMRFESCLAGDMRGGKYKELIEADYKDAVSSGGTGTPFNIIISPNGKKTVVVGAQPYDAIKEVIENSLREN